ncbi:MAG: 3-oxoadipate--succinyl-CoA transferase [Anaerolineae bacterium SG8_19]|jgi:glutaconate CoA-transferase subunit B|nr:MAG: 3-oxoadipate--succinyl-CoA transferase [Anaerolineae bacterium SG8_19]
MEYTPSELMIVSASRALEGSRVVFVGVGLPNIACNLARGDHSPNLELVYESGIFGAHPARLPLSIGDPTLVSDATSAVSMAELFMFYLQGGLVDAALLGGAQIDRYGNLNTTVIGDYANPKVRLPGSGGACEIAINAKKVLIIMRLKQRAFVDRLDFLTSPGHIDGQNTRGKLGLPGAGPELVITDRALFNFDNHSQEMTLFQIAPGESIESIQQEVGWPLLVSENLREMDLPTAEELALIREELDPQGMYR